MASSSKLNVIGSLPYDCSTHTSHRFTRVIFKVLSRLFYGLPIPLGDILRLKSSVAIIQRGEWFLAIERSDGGLALPGGVRRPWESALHCVDRELCEETGLTLKGVKGSVSYCSTIFFFATAEGVLRDSWEGKPRWAKIEELSEASDHDLMQILAPFVKLAERQYKKASSDR